MQGKVALVTGASRARGIGAATCRALAAGGADVFFTHWVPYDRRMGYDADLRQVAALEQEIRAAGVRAASMEVDLSAPESAATVMSAAEAALGPVSILINNAAYSTNGGIDDLDAESLDAHYAVNMRGMALLTAEFVRRYPGGEGGRIINLTSGQSVGPMSGELAYAMTKGAVEAFTTSLAPAVAARGITVNAVDPGATDTGWISPDLMEAIVGSMQMGRVGQPEDAARLIAFLAGSDAGWITGQVIHSRGA